MPCDFEHDTLRGRLLADGFDPTRPSLIIWVGVTVYLTPHAIDSTLADIAAMCAPGSRLVFDDSDGISGGSRSAGVFRWAGSAKRRGEPFRTRFTAASVDALLASHGFVCGEHLRVPELLHMRQHIPIGRP